MLLLKKIVANISVELPLCKYQIAHTELARHLLGHFLNFLKIVVGNTVILEKKKDHCFCLNYCLSFPAAKYLS